MSLAYVVTIPTDIEQDRTLSQQVAYFARVSNPSNQNAPEGKLLQYLIDNKHWSPFEMVTVVMHIVTTRDIARQMLRHRSFSFQEFSQRYAEVAKDLVFRNPRLQDKKNRQNSLPTPDPEIHKAWSEIQNNVAQASILGYDRALKLGIAKEVARSILPEGMTESSMYVSGSLRSWMHYVEVRTHPSTQKEHRELALRCAEALDPYFPYIERFVCSEQSAS